MEVTQLAPRGLFGRCHRLRTRADFTRVFRGGRRLRSRHFAVVARAPANGSQGSRLGLAVSRKCGNAPARARLRRLVREAFRSLRHDLTRPIELVVRPLGPWPEADAHAVHAELGALLQQLEARQQRRRHHRSKTRSESAHGTTSDPAPPPAGVDA